MDKLAQYRQWIQQLLSEYANVKLANESVKVYKSFDTEGDHYQVFHAGWAKYRRIFGPLIHIDILDGKLWIQHDGTEVGIANRLLELGVPAKDIVLGYHAPFMRQHDGFAVG